MTSLSFTGDVAFTKYFQDHWQQDFLDERIYDFLNSSDHVIANVECPISSAPVFSKMGISGGSDPQAGDWFPTVSADIWSLANNHVLDCGESGMLDTIRSAHRNGATTVGAGRNIDEAANYVSLGRDGGIGVFALTYKKAEFLRASEDTPGCILFDETEKIQSTIDEIKRKHRWCIIIAHGGDAFAQLPLPYTRKLYRSFLKMGADIVVAHHPHVVQNYEKVGNKMIFYSLGNFVYDTDQQRLQKHTEYGILLKLRMTKDKFTWEYLPTRINREKQTVETCQAPPVFCNISDRDYRRLWPLAAQKFSKSFIAAKTAVAQTQEYTRRQWFELHAETIGLKNALCLYRGKLISKLNIWKRASSDLRDYIAEN